MACIKGCTTFDGAGGGGYATRTYAAGNLSIGASIPVVVGAGGAVQSAASYTSSVPGAGANGQVGISWTDPTESIPPTPNPETFASAPSAASDTSVSMTASTASDPTAPVQYLFTYSACGSNPGTGGTTSGWQASTAYTNSGLQPNKCYAYNVAARDGFSNTTTASGISSIYTLATVPATPTFSSVNSTSALLGNTANGNPANTEFAIQITAASPADATWNGKYVNAAGAPSATPVWLTDATWDAVTIAGLQNGTQYSVKSMARNISLVQTAQSTVGTFTTTIPPETTPPTPNPMTFSSNPSGASVSSISMTASTASDPSAPVQYLFTYSACGSNGGLGGVSSAWQIATTYTNTGLDVNKCYAYSVTARDAIGNTGTASAVASGYTLANIPGTPTFSSVTSNSAALSNAANSNPSNTQFEVQITATNPTDSTWSGKYVNAAGNPSASAVWQSDAVWDATTIAGLQGNTQYSVNAIARNQDLTQTSTSPTGTFTTLITPAPLAVGTPITGYAWSENIGWIDFNCSNAGTCGTANFGMAINPATSVITGMAWSENIGWVSANSSDLNGCPTAPCTATVDNTGAMRGWMRAIGADNNGWDGWISLSGTGYGPTLSSGTFAGYAWGSDVVGWLQFNADAINPVKTTWQACTDNYFCTGTSQFHQTAQCVTTLQQVCPYQCSAGVCVAPPAPAGTLSGGAALKVTPTLAKINATVSVVWGVNNVTSCSVTSTNGDVWVGVSGTQTSKPITKQTTFSLTCVDLLSASTVISKVTVSLVPRWLEL